MTDFTQLPAACPFPTMTGQPTTCPDARKKS